ncbi:type IV pilus assembly protein PilB [Kordia periserrulae]|uniref:Type IV pilus assembly protein PilB n=1 Tax=Kordia periserrulae TaxID=701523 RepID=A0A2T6C6Z8_9FLAO|nr:GspE/PulE family protein [Kordia periserrulae]PTX64082.1 type IV pilus assembly protein PilB [Kordia periserrulae]
MNSKQAHITLSVEQQQLINAELANHFKVIPLQEDAHEIVLYAEESNQKNANFLQELQLFLDKKIKLTYVDATLIQQALATYYRTGEETATHHNNSTDFLDELIHEAKQIRASDIHIEIFEEEARVRFRIDGLLIEKYKIETINYLELINKIKIRSNLDITEKRLPQDGRINFETFDIRVSILPTHYGEKVVMRLLGRDASHLDLNMLGMDTHELEIYRNAVKKTNGIILISGPTGSGKTTTLYATLKHLNHSKTNIVTVEDPIEYTLKGINQVQLKEDIGLTFTSALRSFLRQDPDIIMLGEIRDAQTAQMAIRASLTGHLVLSTIHTNSALGTISRLMDMGVPAFLIAETLNISIAQRLLRKLCTHCKEKVNLHNEDLPKYLRGDNTLSHQYVAKGCHECYYTGYKGRTAIYEMIPITSEISEIIKKEDLHKAHHHVDNTKSLSHTALQLFKNGITSLEEVYPILLKS